MSGVYPLLKWQNYLREWPVSKLQFHARRTNQNRSPSSSTASTVSNPVQNCCTMAGILGVTCCRNSSTRVGNSENVIIGSVLTGGIMRRLFLLGSLILALPAVSLATSVQYASKGSIGASTATRIGNANAGDSVILTSPLVNINSLPPREP
jgi:hypothetical protein